MGNEHALWYFHRQIAVSVKQAFDRHARDYDSERRQLIPGFDDFYGAALALIPFQPEERFRVLDLGGRYGAVFVFRSTALSQCGIHPV